MRYSYFLYGIFASTLFLFFVSVIAELLGSSDYIFIAICIMFGTIVTCTFYVLELINDLKRDLNNINDN
jgi:phosphotransferase system  glucose/maltose/N-acetylglucosamine-specific IIC component